MDKLLRILGFTMIFLPILLAIGFMSYLIISAGDGWFLLLLIGLGVNVSLGVCLVDKTERN